MTLEALFNFDDNDLQANARGDLTSQQRATLKSYRKYNGYGTVVALLAIVGTIGFLGYMVLTNTDVDSSAMQQALPFIIGVFGIGIGLFILFFLVGIYRSRHLRAGTISEVAGQATHTIKKQQYHIEYYVTIGTVRFQVISKAHYEAFTPEQTYHIYYVKYPPTHIILSVDVI